MLSVFHGQASNAEARIYAQYRVSDPTELSGLSLAGCVHGPQSKFARTLPAKISFRNLAPGESVLAEAIVPDPCFWTPESPYIYLVDLVLEKDGQSLQKSEQVFGVCPLGVKGKHFYLDGSRWVLRGGKQVQLNSNNVGEIREAVIATIITCDQQTEALSAASEQGVFVLGWLSPVRDEVEEDGEGDPEAETKQLLERLERLAAWPAVGMVVIDASVDETLITEHRPRNLLLGQRLQVNETNPEFQPAAWANFVVGDVDDPTLFASFTEHLELPVVAYREASPDLSPAEVRTACEQLQKELSRHGDFAGYLV